MGVGGLGLVLWGMFVFLLGDFCKLRCARGGRERNTLIGGGWMGERWLG